MNETGNEVAPGKILLNETNTIALRKLGKNIQTFGHKIILSLKKHPNPIVDSIKISPSESPEPDEDSVRFEKERFVKEAPLFHDLVSDETRTNTFRYWRRNKMIRSLREGQAPTDSEIIELSEHEGLVQLAQFLERSSLELVNDGDQKHAELAQEAQSLHNNLRYVGEKEFKEAAAGIAKHWKTYLRQDSKNQLCIPAGIIRTNEYKKKSSEYLRKQVMNNFSQQELLDFQKRIATNLDRLPRNIDNTKIILLDDWSISGTQLGNGFASIFRTAGGRKGYENRIEVNLVAASVNQIEHPSIQGRAFPTYAYFRVGSNNEKNEYSQRAPLITGTHSSVDFNFESPIEQMVGALNGIHPDNPVMMPACTNIIRSQY